MRSICTIFFAALLLVSCSSAKQTNSTIASKKNEAKVILPQQQVATPANMSFVYDNEGIFTPAEAKKLDSLVRTFEKSNLISIKLVTINDPAVTKETFDQHNKKILDEWSAAHGNSDKCMAISISKSLRQMRIDFGPFVKRLLSDDEAKSIIENNFKPFFRQEQYYQGTLNGLHALMDTIRKNIKF